MNAVLDCLNWEFEKWRGFFRAETSGRTGKTCACYMTRGGHSVALSLEVLLYSARIGRVPFPTFVESVAALDWRPSWVIGSGLSRPSSGDSLIMRSLNSLFLL